MDIVLVKSLKIIENRLNFHELVDVIRKPCKKI